jgi:ATP-dependent Clp protease ATP-binding subunit ClpC
MFEKYTEKARRVVFFARYEASQLGSPAIESEHLLLGLLRENRDLNRRFFLKTNATVEDIRKEIGMCAMVLDGRTEVREKTSTSIDLPFTEECKRVLNNAADESERLSHKYIGMEHILLGLLREDKSIAAEILKEHGIDPEIIGKEMD